MNNENNSTVNTEQEGLITSAQLDQTMDLGELLKKSKQTLTEVPTSNIGGTGTDNVSEAKTTVTTPDIDPGKGLVVTQEELNAGAADKALMANGQREREESFNQSAAELDGMITAAQGLNIQAPSNPAQMASIMDALSDISANGGQIQAETKEALGNLITNKSETTGENQRTAEEQKAREELVNIVIDKTGFGVNIQLSEEEQLKVRTASQIKITEVQNLELSTIVFTKPEKSFMETVNTYQLATIKTPITLPASRFKASMMGLSFGELADISLNPETITQDQLSKKLSIIYNKMINANIGKFANYEDFLDKLAFTDIELCTFALAVSTFPEVDSVSMTCHAPKCGKTFDHKYSPRSILRFEECHDTFLKAIKLVSEAPTTKDMLEIAANSPVRKHKAFKLPYSNYIVNIGVASANEYLNEIVDKVLDDTFLKAHPEDVNGVLAFMSTFLTYVRSISVPDGPGYKTWERAEDIMHALYSMRPEDMAILSKIIATYNEAYVPKFAFVDIVCPHCGTKTKQVAIDINTLVFRKYQTLEATEIVLENILDL